MSSTSNQTVTLSVDGFGSVADPITKKVEDVKRFTWTNGNGMTVQMISYGAIITTIKVPDRDGNLSDVVLGFDDIGGYQQKGNPYFGALVGRVANRIAHGEFKVGDKQYNIEKNWNNIHSLHGGIVGFDKFPWDSFVDASTKTVHLSHLSPDAYEGYPGAVLTTLSCSLADDNSFRILMKATSTKATPINLTNHSYFNLAGHDTGYSELYKHVVMINADKITNTDHESIPTGKFDCVGGTPFDLRTPRELGTEMIKLPGPGFDDNFCVTRGDAQKLGFVARAFHPSSGRVMEVYSDQPGVQLYTSNFMPDPCGNINPKEMFKQTFYDVDGVLTTKLEQVEMISAPQAPKKCDKPGALIGKGGVEYYKHGALCLETQKFPDAVHHKNFPSIILSPGETYEHEVVYKFSVVDQETCH